MKLTVPDDLSFALISRTQAADRLTKLEQQYAEARNTLETSTAIVMGLAAKVMPFTVGKEYLIMAADRIARATCLYVEPALLPRHALGFNAVFLLVGSKSVVCRIDHESLKSMANDEVTTISVFSRDAITAGYHAARNEPENETD